MPTSEMQSLAMNKMLKHSSLTESIFQPFQALLL